jgi:hypothetical protein
MLALALRSRSALVGQGVFLSIGGQISTLPLLADWHLLVVGVYALAAAVLVSMVLSCFVSMVASVERVTMRSVGVMRTLFVTARLMMLGSLAVVSSRMIEMLSRLGVVLCTLMFVSHGLPHLVSGRRPALKVPPLGVKVGICRVGARISTLRFGKSALGSLGQVERRQMMDFPGGVITDIVLVARVERAVGRCFRGWLRRIAGRAFNLGAPRRVGDRFAVTAIPDYFFAGAVELGVDVADIDTLPYPK